MESKYVSDSKEELSKKVWFDRLKKSLSYTGKNLGSLFWKKKAEIDELFFEELEFELICSDAGIKSTQALLSLLRSEIQEKNIKDPNKIKNLLRILTANYLRPLEKRFPFSKEKLTVITFSGVNGVGKTTSIGKLAYLFQNKGVHVLLAAGDTYRAGAKEQLREWAKQNENITFYNPDDRSPASIAYNAINLAKKNQIKVVLLDTSGRLPSQPHLMEEIKKVNKAVKKAMNGSCYNENILVIDGNTGQNSMLQIKAFNDAIGLTGLIITKLDGTAKAGVLLALANCIDFSYPIPVYWIGIGEKIKDLQPFSADSFSDALFSD